MSSPREQILLMDSNGVKVDIKRLEEKFKTDSKRILADDDIGIIIYVGDLNIFSYKPTQDGKFSINKVTEISSPRFSTKLLRKQIGGIVCTISADTIFIIRNKNTFKKIRADKLKKGMILMTGEKVYS